MEGRTRGCLVWHRRSGKDVSALNFTAMKMFERVGNYWHLFPKQTQARKAIWNGINSSGVKILDQVFPEAIRTRTSTQEMLIEVINRSTWQACGSDNYNSLVGSNPQGVVLSEWSLCDPAAWDYIRPILAENGGWALFIYTARGKNHGWTLYKMARDNPDWVCQKLTVDDTRRHDGRRIITDDIVAAERREGMSEEMVQQEYYCSFEAQIPGAVYGDELRRAVDEGRIGRVPIDPALPLNSAWDLGFNDHTAIWLWQAVGKEVRLIGYYQNNFKPVSHYVLHIKEFALKHGLSWQLGQHYGPHDTTRHDMGGNTVKAHALEAGLHLQETPRPATKRDGIAAVRKLFPKLWIDEARCEIGHSCLSSFHREFDEKKNCYLDEPVHDWASHGADALQTLALGYNETKFGYKHEHPVQIAVGFNVFD